ncbi:MAG: hypothetical protein WA806_12500, partial [Bradyrhizobium sp.]
FSPAPHISFTSPRLRGEVGLRVRNPGEGHLMMVRTRVESPHPNLLPSSGEKEFNLDRDLNRV